MYFMELGAYIKSNVSDIKKFSENTGYSLKDIGRIFDGRLMLSPSQLREISEAIGVSMDEMINHKHNMNIELVGQFSNEHNKIMMLDYIDRYIDLIEAIKMERRKI